MKTGSQHSTDASLDSRVGRRSLCLVTAGLIVLLSSVSHLFALDGQDGDGCGKDETKTDQGCAKNPEVVHKTEPVYPNVARKKGVEGSVTVQARVTEQGTVDEVKALKVEVTDAMFSSNFEASAVAAVRKWRYRPAMIGAKPVACYFTVKIDFTLSR